MNGHTRGGASRRLHWILLGIGFGLAFSSITYAGDDQCNATVTTKDMVDCYNAQLDEAEATLVQAQKHIESLLPRNGRRAFEAATRKWGEFREANCKSISLVYEGGSMQAIVFYSCKARMTKDRLEELHLAFENELHPK